MPQVKILCAGAKTWCIQINIEKGFKVALGSQEGDGGTFSLWLKEWGNMGEGVSDRGSRNENDRKVMKW